MEPIAVGATEAVFVHLDGRQQYYAEKVYLMHANGEVSAFPTIRKPNTLWDAEKVWEVFAGRYRKFGSQVVCLRWWPQGVADPRACTVEADGGGWRTRLPRLLEDAWRKGAPAAVATYWDGMGEWYHGAPLFPVHPICKSHLTIPFAHRFSGQHEYVFAHEDG